MGCDYDKLRFEVQNNVSIHAPVWGATLWQFARSENCRVSIHAPVWGATIIIANIASFGVFQSTHPCGVRPIILDDVHKADVSIHAPVWGATYEQLNH